jgi:hypothetical protein
MKPISYTVHELDWIKAHAVTPRRDAHAEFCSLFSRHDVSLKNYTGLCKRNGWLTGRTGRFDKGAVPINKGQKMPFNENNARTQFKKGQIPQNTKFAGHERLHENGYLYISIDEQNPHTGFERCYVLKHRHLWQIANGQLPEGMVLKCLDGNRANTDPANWEAIPRSALPYLTAKIGIDYDAVEPEVKPSVLMLAKLRQKAHSLTKKAVAS